MRYSLVEKFMSSRLSSPKFAGKRSQPNFNLLNAVTSISVLSEEKNLSAHVDADFHASEKPDCFKVRFGGLKLG